MPERSQHHKSTKRNGLVGVTQRRSADNAAEKSAGPLSLTSRIFRGWLRKRRRDRVRQQGYVRFRLTREGLHFVGILAFIFIGAVIREISLLILLAGAMIGLLLMQWRFNTSTLLGLKVQRQLPKRTHVGGQSDVALSIANPKSWLGAWLVQVEDRIEKILPDHRRSSENGIALVDAVRPRSRVKCSYRLALHERGEYAVGPTQLSTRFPLGLGLGWRVVDEQSRLIVHPRKGKLTPAARKLFHTNQQGQTRSASRAGSEEGEFFGLRPWATGDSKRWIHWRTSARLGQLSVRQFEQQKQRQIAVLLDLCVTEQEANAKHVEMAISFVATLVTTAVHNARNRVAVSVAGEEVTSVTNILSTVLADSFLDKLSVAQPVREPDLATALRGLSIPIQSNASLLVVSTRPNADEHLRAAAQDSLSERLVSTTPLRCLDVSSNDLEPYIQWT